MAWQNEINWRDMGLGELFAMGGPSGISGGLANMFRASGAPPPQAEPMGIAAQLSGMGSPMGGMMQPPTDYSDIRFKDLPEEYRQRAIGSGLAAGLDMYRPQATDSPWGIVANLATGLLKGRQQGVAQYVQEAKDLEERRRRQALDEQAMERYQSLAEATRARTEMAEQAARAEQREAERRYQGAIASGFDPETAEEARRNVDWYENNVLSPKQKQREVERRQQEAEKFHSQYPTLFGSERGRAAVDEYIRTGESKELHEVLEDAAKPEKDATEREGFTFEEYKPFIDARAVSLMNEGYAPQMAYSKAANEVQAAYHSGGEDVVKEVFKKDRVEAARSAIGRPPRKELEESHIAEVAAKEYPDIAKSLQEAFVTSEPAQQALSILQQEAGKGLPSYRAALESFQATLDDLDIPNEDKAVLRSLPNSESAKLQMERTDWIKRQATRKPDSSLASNLPVDRDAPTPEQHDPQALAREVDNVMSNLEVRDSEKQLIQAQMRQNPQEFNRILQSRFNGDIRRMIRETILRMEAMN